MSALVAVLAPCLFVAAVIAADAIYILISAGGQR